MEKIILLLSAIIIMGVGCGSAPSQPQPKSGILPIAKIETEGFTKIKSDWVLTNSANGANFSQNVSFLRPPEFKVSGSDADYGRVTILELNNKTVIEIIENSIFLECPKATCEDLEDYISTTPEKYFNSYLQRLEREGVKVEDKKVGNLSGKVFFNSKNKPTAVVLFKKAMYIINDERETGSWDGLLLDFIASFQFNKELELSKPLAIASDGRKILVPGNYDYMPEVCKSEFNMDPANTSVVYSSKEYGISLKIPFNEKWGNKECTISPYYEIIEDGAALLFGNIDVGFEGGCGVGRTVKMYFKLPQTIEAMVAGSGRDESTKNIVQKQINGLSVLTYQTANDYCGKEGYDSHLIIAGKKYNYWFYQTCEKNTQNIEKIIQTAKLIE